MNASSFPLPLVLATGNPDKAREISEIFVTRLDEPLAARAITAGGDTFGFLVDRFGTAATRPLDDGDDLAEAPDVEETGTTLEENARIKASALAGATGMLAVADDTGLEVDALGGAPGVRSARYAPTDPERREKVLKGLKGIPEFRRGAHFFCAVALSEPQGACVAHEDGRVDGSIAAAPRGTNGFGYDPLFLPAETPGNTLAELGAEEKNQLSHRGRALRRMLPQLARLARDGGL